MIILTPCAKLILFGLLLVYEITLRPSSDVNIMSETYWKKILRKEAENRNLQVPDQGILAMCVWLLTAW